MDSRAKKIDQESEKRIGASEFQKRLAGIKAHYNEGPGTYLPPRNSSTTRKDENVSANHKQDSIASETKNLTSKLASPRLARKVETVDAATQTEDFEITSNTDGAQALQAYYPDQSAESYDQAWADYYQSASYYDNQAQESQSAGSEGSNQYSYDATNALQPGYDQTWSEYSYQAPEPSELEKKVTEFYEKLRDFHHRMQALVPAFDKLKEALPRDYQYLLTDLLKPYKDLQQNPLSEPSTDVLQNLNQITQVVNENNEQFNNALTAFKDCITNLELFNQFLNTLQKDDQLMQHLKEELGQKSTLDVASYVNNPYQYLFRYELLLGAIFKKLKDEPDEESQKLFAQIGTPLADALSYLKAHNEKLNQHGPTLSFIKRCQSILSFLLAKEIQKEQDGQKSLRQNIEAIYPIIEESKNNIITDKEEPLELYQRLVHFLEYLVDEYNKEKQAYKNKAYSLVTQTATAGYSLITSPFRLFNSTEPQKIQEYDPVNDLIQYVHDLKSSINYIEAIQEKQSRARPV